MTADIHPDREIRLTVSVRQDPVTGPEFEFVCSCRWRQASFTTRGRAEMAGRTHVHVDHDQASAVVDHVYTPAPAAGTTRTKQ